MPNGLVENVLFIYNGYMENRLNAEDIELGAIEAVADADMAGEITNSAAGDVDVWDSVDEIRDESGEDIISVLENEREELLLAVSHLNKRVAELEARVAALEKDRR